MSDDRKIFSLLDVTRSIQRTVEERYRSAFWVKAEMIKLNFYSHSGHCYPDLVEKRDGKVVAQMKAVLWKNDYFRVDQKFRHVLKEPLKDGVNILFLTSITFDPHYGLSLNILDIDPAFSLGELEREKQETIQKLTQEGIFSLNKSQPLALLPQRIAVISVETSKGYADYLKMIDDNPKNFKLFNFLFPSLLQGDRAVQSIIGQLHRIKKVIRHFDAVAIIRGGGGDLGLSSYNNYHLAREIALFPIPVFTGIGHSTNETVSEMVCYRNAITPTELADFFLKKFEHFSSVIDRSVEAINIRSRRIVSDKMMTLENVVRYFQAVTKTSILKHHNGLTAHARGLSHHSKRLVDRHRHHLLSARENLAYTCEELLAHEKDNLTTTSGEIDTHSREMLQQHQQEITAIEKTVRILDPANVLKRGFSITLKNGKSLKHSDEVDDRDVITTILADGEITSVVNKSKK